MNHQIVPASTTVKMTPYVLALASNELRRAAEDLVSERFPVTNFLLHAMSIEIGLKAAILNCDCSAEMKGRIKTEIGHDLLKAHEMYQSICHSTLFDDADLNALEKLNRYFKGKKLEYFTVEMLAAMVTAFSEFPSLDEIRRCNTKVEEMLQASDHFLHD